MTIDPTTLPDAAIVETTADHFTAGGTHLTTMREVRIRGDLTVLRVLLPIPDGVTLLAAIGALASIDPSADADLINRMAKATHYGAITNPKPWKHVPRHLKDKYRAGARAALAAVRESEAGAR